MGIGLFGGSSGCSCSTVKQYIKIEVPTGNPDPTKFKIIRDQTMGNNVIAEIEYPDSNNYEGRKILVYKGITTEALLAAEYLDPHFCNSTDHISPIARFEPTEYGWHLAIQLCYYIHMTSKQGIQKG